MCVHWKGLPPEDIYCLPNINMKHLVIAAIALLVLNYAQQATSNNCNVQEKEKCTEEYAEEIEDAGSDIIEMCDAIRVYQKCVEDADCTVPYDMGTIIIRGKVAYKCGAAGMTINVAILLLTSLVAMKNYM